VIGSMSPPTRRVRLNARTRGLPGTAALFAGVACLLDSAFALGHGWSGWLLAPVPVACFVAWLAVSATASEWDVVGGALERRKWLSPPGTEPAIVIELGPQLQIVHESRYRWRFQPTAAVIDLYPWQTTALTGAVEQAGVRVRDTRADWARANRPLATPGALAPIGGLGILLLTVWLGVQVQFSNFAVVASACLIVAGAAVDRMPARWSAWAS
jgi:hypothetical protein